MPTPTLGTLAVNDLIYVAFKMRLYGQRVMNTMYYTIPTVGGAATDRWTAYANLNTLLSQANGLRDDLLACMTADVTLESIRCQFVAPQRMAYREFLSGLVGTHAGVCATPNISASIERRAELASRHGVGRVQIAGLPTTAYATGVINPAYSLVQAFLAAELAADVTDPAGNVYRPCLAYPDPLAIGGWVASPVIGTDLKTTVRTMRRRGIGLGE